LCLRGDEDQRPDAANAKEGEYLPPPHTTRAEGMQCNGQGLSHGGALIAASGGHHLAHPCGDLRQFGESSIGVQPEHKILCAQVAPPFCAPATLPAPPGSPWHDPLTHGETFYLWTHRRNAPDELVPQDHRTTMPTGWIPDIQRDEQRAVCKLSGVCSTYPSHEHLKHHLSPAWPAGIGPLFDPHISPSMIDSSFHRLPPPFHAGCVPA